MLKTEGRWVLSEGRFKELLNPVAYLHAPEEVELRQTHISYLFLTPDFVYKVKKPVNFGFLDFTTLEKRRHYCAEEVRLNSRLAPDVYLGVVEIKEDGGRLIVEGKSGNTVEYAVKMRRLAAENILEEKIRQGTASVEDIQRVASAIAHFHRGAESGAHISEYGRPEMIEKNINENFVQTKSFAGRFISPASYDAMQSFALGFMKNKRASLLKRVKDGFIRDCHGDIHSEHISIDGSIDIIDCIEFNERFRYSDTISDMAFLSMDLDFHNRCDFSAAFEKSYLEASGDASGKELILFYKSYRAYVRGKVEGLKAAEDEVGKAERQAARLKAARYFDLAEAYTQGAPRPRLIIICGLSGTGKSTLARALGKALWAESLATDRIRRELRSPTNADSPTQYGEGPYSIEERTRTYRELFRRACADYLQKGRTVILDATFSKNSLLTEAVSSARKAGLEPEDITIFECLLEMGLLKERIGKRQREGGAEDLPLSEMRVDIFKAHLDEYEKKEGDIVPLNTASPPRENLQAMIKVILKKGKDREPGG
ncbi:MAG: AAA family ATPase [Thermodesulfobacteriota bacterium]